MKSTSGAHYIALDHVRALAAFMVFAWHFTHTVYQFPIPYDYTPSIFPFALLDEGHTGVALFMTLSGYLFAKLLDGKRISYPAFFWNRAVRLLPLLAVVIVAVGVLNHRHDFRQYAADVAWGVLLPSLPNGGWSITCEFHFYALLPFLLWLMRKSSFLPLALIVASTSLRWLILAERGEVQSLAYFTIIGRIDQFVLGMVVCQHRDFFARRHVLAASTFLAFALFYWWFDAIGGFYRMPKYPSPSVLWVFLPTIEGLVYSILIAWYDRSFAHSATGSSAFVGRIGEYSYSIYLLHFFVVFRIPGSVNKRVMDLSNFYVTCAWAVLFFLLMMPLSYLSFRFIEEPFLRLRKRYILDRPASGPPPAVAAETPAAAGPEALRAAGES